jgi:transposase
MGRRIQMEAHLSREELRKRYRTTSHSAEKAHWQVLWLMAAGKSALEAAEATGYTLNWVRMLVGRYNRGGPEGVADGRRNHSGRPPLLSVEQRAELSAALEGPAPRGGLWSGPEVARWMSQKLGRTVRPQRGWEYLRKAGYTPQIPRPKHGDSDPEAQEAFQVRTPRARSPGADGPP